MVLTSPMREGVKALMVKDRPVSPVTSLTGSWQASWGPAPRFATARTPGRETFGPQIRAIAKLLGLDRMDHQEYVWDVALEVQSEAAGDPNPGAWAYDTVTVTMPRRSGKTTLLQPVTMHRAEMIRRAYMVMTAQSGKAASKRWLDLANVIEDSYMGDRVKKRVSIGHERLTWHKSKAVFEPFAPSDDANHGDEPDLILATEIWKWSAEQGAALEQGIRPTFLTNNAQFWRESTAGTDESSYYNGVRQLGRKAVEEGRQLGHAYFEWSVPEKVDGVAVEDLDDDALIDLVIAHHPRSDLDMRRFLVEELERSQLPTGEGRSLGFLRPYGNHVTEAVGRPALIDPSALASALVVDHIPADANVPVGLAFDLDPDGRQGAVAAAWRDRHGRAIVEVVKVSVGTRWLPAFIAGVWERQVNEIREVLVNDTAVTRDAADVLKAAGVKVTGLSLKDYAAAWDRFRGEMAATDRTGVHAPTVLHRGSNEFITAVNEGGSRVVGGMSLPAASGEPVAVLNAMFMAVWAFDHLPEPEQDLGEFRIF